MTSIAPLLSFAIYRAAVAPPAPPPTTTTRALAPNAIEGAARIAEPAASPVVNFLRENLVMFPPYVFQVVRL